MRITTIGAMVLLLMFFWGCKRADKALDAIDAFKREMKPLDRYKCHGCGGLKRFPCPSCITTGGTETQLTPYGWVANPCRRCGGGQWIVCSVCHGLGYH